jgi:hypothetical protein
MENILDKFFNSSSDASNLEASQQEELQKSFKEWLINKKPSFEESVKPLIMYLAHNHHPHTSVYVRNNVAELLEGKQSFITDEYILD